MQSFVQALHQALSEEMRLRLPVAHDVFLDWARLSVGESIEDQLSGALCTSACMIAIYTPTYFSATNLFCAREYRAMELIEEHRQQMWPREGERYQQRMILPVVLRGFSHLPEPLRSRQCIDFSDFVLTDRDLLKQRRFGKAICDVAEYVERVVHSLAPISSRVCESCDDFRFPSEDDIRGWLPAYVGDRPPPFPGLGRP